MMSLLTCQRISPSGSGTRGGQRSIALRFIAMSISMYSLVVVMEVLDGGVPRVGQATAPPVERCPARFRPVRDEYLSACRRRGNAEASVVTKKRAADQFLAYLDEVGRETLDQAQARDLAGFWARCQHRGYAPKTSGSLRSALADFLRHLREDGQIREDLAGRLPPQRYPRRGQSAPHPWTAGDVRLVLEQIDRQSAIGKRDCAMVLLTVRLGVRVGDLRRLELGWFDWRAKTLAFRQHKTRLVHLGGLPAELLRAARRDRVRGRTLARPAFAARRAGGRDAPGRHAAAGGDRCSGSRGGHHDRRALSQARHRAPAPLRP